MTCTSRGLVTVVKLSRLKTIQWLIFCSSKILNFERMVLLFSRFFLFFNFFIFMEDSKYLYFNRAKNCHKVTSLGELNATEIQQNIIEMFVVRVYF